MIIAIEGIDAAGKNTQAQLLKQRLLALGLGGEILSFPRYGKTLFAKTIGEYLNGKFGDLASIDPHFSSLLYSGDRFESRDVLTSLAKLNDVLILDRYVGSNLAYQAARVESDYRVEFISWLSKIEYDIYGLPRADRTLYLDIPPDVASTMLARKDQRSYTNEVADLYERDIRYLAACREVYRSLVKMNFESSWVLIDCVSPDGLLRSIAEISDMIWNSLRPLFEGKPDPGCSA